MLKPNAGLLASLLDPFFAFRFDSAPIIVAISGGSDSTALLLLLKTFLERSPVGARIVAVTVDHGLRTASADEARAAGTFATALGIEHRVVEWQGDKPTAGLAAAARLARYKLLAGVARAIGATTILTGHTADDQAETVAMRASRGTGPGLAGMAPATLFDGATWIARPLLGTRRLDLRTYLAERNVGWIDDPSNADARYERVRVRSGLASSDDRIEALLTLAARSGASRVDLGMDAAALIAQHVTLAAPGLMHVRPDFYAADDGLVALHAFRILLSTAGGCEHLPDEKRTQALLADIRRPPHRTTLSRVMIASRRDGVWICRENRGLPLPGPANAGAIWDGRFRLVGAQKGQPAIVYAMGSDRSSEIAIGAAMPASLARAAFATRGRVDDASGWSLAPIAAPWASFLPSFDLAPAIAVSRLIGATQPPPPPFADHIVTAA